MLDILKEIAINYSEKELCKNFEVILNAGLKEDIGSGDITSEAIIDNNKIGKCFIIAKENTIVCGLPLVEYTFKTLNQNINVQKLVSEGSEVVREDKICEISGNIKSILTAERMALNILQHLSGIATKTSEYVQLLKGTSTQILDTRKTLPGYRYLEKYAVKTGGGTNHRFGLYSMYLIKDNHIQIAGGIKQALRKARIHNTKKLPIEIECKTIEQVKEASDEYADIIMLDNMDQSRIKQAKQIVLNHCKLEVSGNVTISKLENLARLGIDYISAGALTHSVRAADYSLLFY